MKVWVVESWSDFSSEVINVCATGSSATNQTENIYDLQRGHTDD